MEGRGARVCTRFILRHRTLAVAAPQRGITTVTAKVAVPSRFRKNTKSCPLGESSTSQQGEKRNMVEV